MKKLLLVIISFVGFSSIAMAQAAETVESAAKAEAQNATQQPTSLRAAKAKATTKSSGAKVTDATSQESISSKLQKKAKANSKAVPSTSAPSFSGAPKN